MAKNKPDTIEYIPENEDTVYQTGSIHEPRRSSALLTFLLLLVIFLGGVCSLLGLLNIRLLSQFSHDPDEMLPVQMDSAPQSSMPTQFSLDVMEEPVPQIPKNRAVNLQIVDSPYFFSEQSAGQILSDEAIYQRNIQSVVQIQCLNHFNAVQSGVGLVISADGYILTNNHVVDETARIFVRLCDGTTLRAALVGYDHFSDLAVLYVQKEDLQPAVFSSNRNLHMTEPTYALESLEPDGQLLCSTVFSTNRRLSSKSNSLDLIQTCTGGNTGPVFDSFGNVIGFQVGNIAQFFPTDDINGVGLILPTSSIQKIVGQLLSEGRMPGQPSLGIDVEEISKVYQQYWQLPSGLLLTNVADNSNAALCGLQKGDILLALDGNPINDYNDLYSILYNLDVGDTVIAVICRDNQKFTVKLTVEDNNPDS